MCAPERLAVVLARVGQSTQCVKSGTLAELERVDFGGPLHSMVLVGEMHELEKVFFERLRVDLSKDKLLPPKPVAASFSLLSASNSSAADED